MAGHESGLLQYKVKVEKKNEEMWAYLKKEIFKRTKDAIFDFGVTEIPNIKESRQPTKPLERIRAGTGFPPRR